MQKHSENKSLNDLIARAKNERGPSLADLAEKEMCVACGDRFENLIKGDKSWDG